MALIPSPMSQIAVGMAEPIMIPSQKRRVKCTQLKAEPIAIIGMATFR
jgi:hypothetical protein